MDRRVGERLRQVRKELGYTQLQFSKTAGIPRSTYTKFELGTNIPKNVYLNCICDRYNVSQEWLLEGTGAMFKEQGEDGGFQAKLVRLFRKSPPGIQLEIYRMASSLAEKGESEADARSGEVDDKGRREDADDENDLNDHKDHKTDRERRWSRRRRRR
jgi:transcriptional regulator with XRE-family HTH domain